MLRAAALLVVATLGLASAAGDTPLLCLPPEGHLYHGVYPGGTSGDEDDLTPEDLQAYQAAAGRPVAWVYFSHNWFRSRLFPGETVAWIRRTGAIPYIRLMLRSDTDEDEDEDEEEKVYTLDAINAGTFDADLGAWGRAAAAVPGPLLAEWGTECNGEWFPWNAGEYREDRPHLGTRAFASAYRRIIDIVRAAGATNVLWGFHVAAEDVPEEPWNRFERYFPGPERIDFLAVSVYGPTTPEDDDDEAQGFAVLMDKAYPRLAALAPGKPVIVAECGCTAGHHLVPPERWAADALAALLARRWPQVIGFAWWNERWENEEPCPPTTMRLQDTPALAAAFREALAQAGARIEDRPILRGPPPRTPPPSPNR